jgi:hypothetical protein
MSLLTDVRLGAQEPVISHLPPDVHSLAAAEEAIELADAYGVCDGNPLSESQKITLRAAGGERADGLWAATRIGDFGPRQGTGKNDKIAAWELAHLLLFGTQLIIHTAHEFPTANESFLRLVAVFENYDDLGKKVDRIRYANGEQGIELLSGQRLKYRARTGGSGRGFAKAGLLIYDEAQHLHREHVAASGPAKLANPNSQTWYAGSGGLATSGPAWALRRAAILGNGGRLAYTEMTGETITVDPDGTIHTELPDPADRDVWYETIPGLGRWVTEEGVEGLADELGDLFAREILCVWDPEPDLEGATWVFPKDRYEAGLAPGSKIVDKAATLAIAVSPDRQWAALAAAGKSNMGGVHGGVLRYDRGTEWIPEEVKKYGTNVVIGKDSPAMAVVPDLTKAGIVVEEWTTAQQGAAFAQVFDLVERGEFWHLGQGELNLSVKCAELRETEGGARLLSPKRSSVDISPLVAVTLAASKYLQPAETEPEGWVMVIGGDT